MDHAVQAAKTHFDPIRPHVVGPLLAPKHKNCGFLLTEMSLLDLCPEPFQPASDRSMPSGSMPSPAGFLFLVSVGLLSSLFLVANTAELTT